MIWKALVLAGALAAVGTLARGQQSSPVPGAQTTYSVNMCAIAGSVDGFGNPLFAYCGYPNNPFTVTIQQQAPFIVQSRTCPNNPLTGKAGVLC